MIMFELELSHLVIQRRMMIENEQLLIECYLMLVMEFVLMDLHLLSLLLLMGLIQKVV